MSTKDNRKPQHLYTDAYVDHLILKIQMARKVMHDIDLDTVEIDGVLYYGAARIMGTWNPDGADRCLRKAQGIIFRSLEALGYPINGWMRFDDLMSDWE